MYDTHILDITHRSRKLNYKYERGIGIFHSEIRLLSTLAVKLAEQQNIKHDVYLSDLSVYRKYCLFLKHVFFNLISLLIYS